MDRHSSVEQITRQLLQFDTVNPPGNEAASMHSVARFLDGIGFQCEIVDHGQSRASLIASRGLGAGSPICFSGHLDTVPLGSAPWSVDPFAGEIKGDKLFGRGASDMKGGVAAFLHAVARCDPKGGVVILLTAGEEAGCDGARWLIERGRLPKIGAMIVGESTDNQVYYGHKGVLWMRATCFGKTAHGATPELGENAIEKAIPLLSKLAAYDPAATHPEMGHATANIGMIKGGLNINSVPDTCEISIDIRSVAGQSHRDIQRQISALIDGYGQTETLLDLPSVWTPPELPWPTRVEKLAQNFVGRHDDNKSVNYFTDAALLKPALGSPPTIILGPGSLDQPHTTDEYVLISRLQECATLYRTMLVDWPNV